MKASIAKAVIAVLCGYRDSLQEPSASCLLASHSRALSMAFCVGVSFLLPRRRRLALGNIDVVLLDERGVFGGQFVAEGLADQFALAGREVDEAAAGFAFGCLRIGVAQLAIRRPFPLPLVVVLLF